MKRLLARVPLYSRLADLRLRRRTTERIFADIIDRNKWGGSESLSGPGSSVAEARILISELPTLLRDLGVDTLLDLPCGDFNWMQHVDLGGVDYIGADIVAHVVAANTATFAAPSVRFLRIDLLTDRLPRVDLILCRDALVHFSDRDVGVALRAICESDSEFLLTTTFTARDRNMDIVTGRWRPLNLEIAPFHLPPPITALVEGTTAGDGAFADKSLALWRIADIRARLDSMPSPRGVAHDPEDVRR